MVGYLDVEEHIEQKASLLAEISTLIFCQSCGHKSSYESLCWVEILGFLPHSNFWYLIKRNYVKSVNFMVKFIMS